MTCGVNGCTRSFHSMKTYRNHLYRNHMINFDPDKLFISLLHNPNPDGDPDPAAVPDSVLDLRSGTSLR